MIPKLNILMSYGVMGKTKMFYDVIEGINPLTNILIDSGAYTNRKTHIQIVKKGVGDDKIITLDQYTQALKRFGEHVWGYFNLDVIGEPEPTKANYTQLMEQGFKPIPVITPGMTAEDILDLMKTSKRVSIASSVKNEKIVKFVNNESGGKSDIHLLGYSSYPSILQMPIKYCDSSSFMAGGRYGTFCIFDKVAGVRTINIKRDASKGRITAEVLNELERNNVSLKDIETNFGKGIMSALNLTTINAYVELHKKVADKVAYFFSISTLDWMDGIVSVSISKTGGTGFDYKTAREHYTQLRDYRKNDTKRYITELADLLTKYTDFQTVLE